MRLKPFQTNLENKNWQALCEVATQEMKQHITQPLQISGSDIQEKMVAICKSNWQHARLPGLPVVRQIDAIQVRPPANYQNNQRGIMIFNPPYGERLSIKGGDQDRPIPFNQGNSSYMQKRRTSREPLVKEIGRAHV